MRLLRLLVVLVGDTLQRLGTALLSWAGVGARDDADEPLAADGPPEHLVRYLRERAPWLSTGNRPLPTRAALTLRRTPATDTVAERATSAAPSSQPDAVDSAPAKAESVQPRATQARVPATPRASVPLVRPLNPESRSPRNLERRSSPDPEVRSLSAGVPIRHRPSQESPAVSAQPAATPKSTPTRWSPARRESIAAPLWSEPAARELAVRESAVRESSVRESGTPPLTHDSVSTLDWWASLPVPVSRFDASPERESATPTLDVFSVASAEPRERRSVRTFEPAPDDGIRVSQAPPTPVAAADVGNWATLPDKGSEEWEVQSTRSLLREQRHLSRLLAEQAGYSWSAPHS